MTERKGHGKKTYLLAALKYAQTKTNLLQVTESYMLCGFSTERSAEYSKATSAHRYGH